MLVKLPEVLLIDDKGGKPEGINLVIGRRPLRGVWQFDGRPADAGIAQAAAGPRLMMLVHHDDAGREYAYGPESESARSATLSLLRGQERHWSVVSMKSDGKRIFPFEK